VATPSCRSLTERGTGAEAPAHNPNVS
jgi:hypothetical protein